MGEVVDTGARTRVTLLGALQVSRGDTVVPVTGARLRGLLARLALAGGRPVDNATLVDALWPDDQPTDTANALQSLVSRLRRLLGSAGTVAQVEGGYRLAVDPEDVDALSFERLAVSGRDRLRAGDPAGAAALLGEAVRLCRGHTGAESALIAAVAPGTAARLARAAVEADVDLAEAEIALGKPGAAEGRLIGLLAEAPGHERVAALLMDALTAQGRQAEALAVYERVREDLADKLGADPGAALRERHLRLLRSPENAAKQQPATTPATAPVGDDTPPSNLPGSLTSFIGREDDLARIDTLLAAGRLVTVLGPGGAGKTRLALEASRRRRDRYRDGTWLVDLASVTEPVKVGAAVLAAAGLRGSALFDIGRARSQDVDVLADQLGGRECLLLVDNCEHLIDAVAHLIAALLPRCPRMRILATSREPLAVDGEALVPLGPLALPDAGAGAAEARGATAVRLFTERAAAVRPGFAVDADTVGEVVRIVRGLDGLPLALELAAARLRTLSLADLAAGLSDRFRLLTTGSRTALPRHRTLRAVIAWSWDLLSADERTVAERVSVLPGGVTAASATAVAAGTAVPAPDVPDLLAALVDKSLLQLAPEPGRYRMLETLREYGIDRLAGQEVLDEVRGLAARHIAGVITAADPLLRGGEQLAALSVLRAEYDNALAALRQLCDEGQGRAAVKLALDLGWYWQMFGRHADAAYWLGETLAVPGLDNSLLTDCARAIHLLNRIGSERGLIAESVTQQQARLHELAQRLLSYPSLPGLTGALAAVVLHFAKEVDAAMAHIDRLIAGDDVWLASLARLFRAQIAENDGDLGRLREDIEAAIAGFRETGDRWGQTTALPLRALLRQYEGDLDGALTDLRTAKALAGEFGALDLNDEVFIDLRWADLHLRRGEPRLAIDRITAARTRATGSALPELVVIVDALEAAIWVYLGDYQRADRLLTVAEQSLPGSPSVVAGDHGAALVGATRANLQVEIGDLAGAASTLAAAYSAAVETADSPLLAIVALAAARLADRIGRPHDTARMLGAAARLRGTHDRTDLQVIELAGRSRTVLGDEAFALAYGAGWALDGKAARLAIDPARLRGEALDGEALDGQTVDGQALHGEALSAGGSASLPSLPEIAG